MKCALSSEPWALSLETWSPEPWALSFYCLTKALAGVMKAPARVIKALARDITAPARDITALARDITAFAGDITALARHMSPCSACSQKSRNRWFFYKNAGFLILLLWSVLWALSPEPWALKLEALSPEPWALPALLKLLLKEDFLRASSSQGPLESLGACLPRALGEAGEFPSGTWCGSLCGKTDGSGSGSSLKPRE